MPHSTAHSFAPATDTHSDNGRAPVVVDLTNDSDSDSNNGGINIPRVARTTSKASAYPPNRASRPSELLTTPARNSPTARNEATSNGYLQAQAQPTVAGARVEDMREDVARSRKRRRMSNPRDDNEGIRFEAYTTAPAQSTQRPNHKGNLGAKLKTMNGAPSVHFMNSALKPSGPSSSLLGQFPVIAARPLLLDNVFQGNSASGLPSPNLTTPESRTAVAVHTNTLDDDVMEMIQPSPRQTEAPAARQIENSPKHFLPPRHSAHIQDADRDNVISELPVRRSTPQKAQQNLTSPQFPTTANPSAPEPAQLSNDHPPASAAEAADHFLIFLKEVKKLKWADITREFQKDIPGRSYIQLQSRYSSKLNKRDRTQDPPTLALPPRFAAEATIDWATVHADTEGPRPPRIYRESTELEIGSSRNASVGRPRKMQHGRDDESSGADSAPQQQRRRRAPPINYTWPNMRTTEGKTEESLDRKDANFDQSPDFAAPPRSESPAGRNLVAPDTRAVTYHAPLKADSCLQDAQLGISMQTLHNFAAECVPYLSAAQRLAMSSEAERYTWEPQNIQDWQGTVLHVDFSPTELQIVEEVIAKIVPSRPQSHHSTYRRYLRAVLKGLSPPKLQKLAYEVKRHVRSRDLQSIAAFFEDAATGMVSNLPQVQRLAMIKQSSKFGSIPNVSVSSIVRRRELGLQSRRGWQTATVPTTYKLKNQLMDTMGLQATWTGASSDIHTVAWSPDGQYFAAGAVAVTDPDSMQYNRPNVLLYGDTINGRIHELGGHSIERERTEAGANSTLAMHVSQDPRLFTTVSSVAFSPSGNLMYSSGYDKSVCIWDVTAGSKQPHLVRQLSHGAPVDILAVNPVRAGNFATATKRTTEKSIKLISIDEESSIHDNNCSTDVANFASAKAMSRPDLNMSANTLKFDPTGQLLLAGFGANMLGDSGLDTSGDICLWDVETQAALQVHGSSRNVFDVTFNPALRSKGLFAVGCVANSNVNRGTRSVVRFYSVKESKADSSIKFTCPLELECKAYDMNDVVWCPYDANLFAAGCTDGRSYIWDLRRPDRVLYILSHGRSLMPLQDGIHPEKTDTGIRFLSWGQNARRLYSGSSDGTVKVWDVNQAQDDVFIKDLITVNSGIMSGAFTADYSKLVVGEVNGTANVLEVGRDDITLKDAEKIQYQPYLGSYDDDESASDEETYVISDLPTNIAAAEARTWLNTDQLKLAPMGGLPKQQVIQGPNYKGPYDYAENAQFLREQAFNFQCSMAATKGLQCNLKHCADSINTTTYEDNGDSGRSKDRIPNELQQRWLDESPRTVPGKSKCTHCSRPAIPSTDLDTEALCERCSFSCFRCGAAGSLGGSAPIFACGSCGGAWDIGALGYECVQQPSGPQRAFNVPALKKYGKQSYLERPEDPDTTYGDETNALTDYYFGLAIDRPESPGL